MSSYERMMDYQAEPQVQVLALTWDWQGNDMEHDPNHVLRYYQHNHAFMFLDKWHVAQDITHGWAWVMV